MKHEDKSLILLDYIAGLVVNYGISNICIAKPATNDLVFFPEYFAFKFG